MVTGAVVLVFISEIIVVIVVVDSTIVWIGIRTVKEIDGTCVVIVS